MDYIFKQGEVSYEEELRKKAVDLEKSLYFDFWTFFKTLVGHPILHYLSSIIPLFNRLFILLFNPLVIHSCIHSIIHSIIHSFTHSGNRPFEMI